MKLSSFSPHPKPGEVPNELQGLTLLEEMLIAQVLPCMHMFRLTPAQNTGGGQWAYRGHCISFDQNINTFAKKLPRRVNTLDKMGLVVVRKKAKRGQKVNGYKDFSVRGQKIKDALRWLQTHNPAYAHIEIDFEYCDALPDGGVPSDLPEVVVTDDEGEEAAKDADRKAKAEQRRRNQKAKQDKEEFEAKLKKMAKGRRARAQADFDKNVKERAEAWEAEDAAKKAAAAKAKARRQDPRVLGEKVSDRDGLDEHSSVPPEQQGDLLEADKVRAAAQNVGGGEGGGDGGGGGGKEPVPWPKTGERPLGDNHDSLFTKAFPTLFPYGAGDYNWGEQSWTTGYDENQERVTAHKPPPVQFANWLRFLMRHKSMRFATHPRFRHYVNNMHLRGTTSGLSSLFVRREAKGIANALELKELLDGDDAGLYRRLQGYGGKMSGSPAWKRARRAELEDLITWRGPPTFSHSCVTSVVFFVSVSLRK
jgi:hypothetical protein